MLYYAVQFVMFRVMTKSMLAVWCIMIALVLSCFTFVIVQSVDLDQPIGDDDKINLTLYHWDNGGNTETDLVYEVCEKFEEKYPHINVTVEIISSYESQFRNFMAASNVPDVFCVPDGNFGQWVETGVMLNIQEYYDNTTNEGIDKEHIASSALKRYRWNGKTMGTGDLYCMPKDITPYVMYYNKDLFDQYDVPYPTEVEYWVNECKELELYAYIHTDKEITPEDYDKIGQIAIENGILDPYAAMCMWMRFGYFRDTIKSTNPIKFTKDHIYGVAKFYPESLVWSNGADYLNVSEDKVEVMINSPEFVEAFEYMVAGQTEYGVAATSEVITSTSEKTMFLNGSAACFIEGRSSTTDLRNKADFDWDIAPIPAFTNNQNCNGWSGSVGYGVYVNTKHPDEAYLLAEYFTSKEGQFIMAEAGFTAPLYNDEETIQKFLEIEEGKLPANTQEFIRAAQYQRPGLWQYLPSVKWKEFFDVSSGAMFNGTTDPKFFVMDYETKLLDKIREDFPDLVD